MTNHIEIGRPRNLFPGLFAVSMAVLLLELSLTRVFDVLYLPNLAYIIISGAVFAFGLAGVFLSVFPLQQYTLNELLWRLASAFGFSVILLYPVVRFVPFDYTLVPTEMVRQIGYFAVLYLALLVPFFLAGLIVALLFSRRSEISRRLYFWDLLGASAGALMMAPLIPYFGGGGLLLLAGGLGLAAASRFRTNGTGVTILLAALAVGAVVTPLAWPDLFPVDSHIKKIGLWGEQTPDMRGDREATIWDPVSKIDVVKRADNRKRIAYDGGTQSSTLFPFDGDYSRLRKEFGPAHYWSKSVIASHYLKADSGAKVLIIGSAGGQETKSALAFGAAHVDAVEMVGAVVRLVQGQYADYIGGVFNDPRVTLVVGEGRSFLRSKGTRYDIIQIFSNHTSSMIGSGAMGMSTNYLQTVEAYKEYFQHLNPDGILHINHPIYPRMLTTASAAWHQLGRNDFQRHVVVLDEVAGSTLPTFLVSMKPWTAGQVDQIRELFFSLYEDQPKYVMVFDPFHPEQAEISLDFFRVPLPQALVTRLDYQILPSTDDWPFFNFIRRRLGALGDTPRWMPRGTEKILRSFTRSKVPIDVLHVLVTGVVALFYAGVFLFVPLYFSEGGRGPWRGKAPTLVYFSSLGAGFIILELVFINVFMKLVGFPVYSYAVVIASLLVAAGIGSLLSEKLRPMERLGGRWVLAGIIALGCLEILLLPRAFELLLSEPLWLRIVAASLLLLPIGLVLGIPFPFGLTLLGARVPEAVPWAWAMNGLFTVVGGLLSIVFSLLFGFRVALLLGLVFYVVAFLVWPRVERAASSEVMTRGAGKAPLREAHGSSFSTRREDGAGT
jgi:spermidine synthase